MFSSLSNKRPRWNLLIKSIIVHSGISVYPKLSPERSFGTRGRLGQPIFSSKQINAVVKKGQTLCQNGSKMVFLAKASLIRGMHGKHFKFK